MTDSITYYAILDEDSGLERPVGVLRRVETASGQLDEAFSRNLKWEFPPLLYSAERGDTRYDFTPISAVEALRIVARIQAEHDRG